MDGSRRVLQCGGALSETDEHFEMLIGTHSGRALAVAVLRCGDLGINFDSEIVEGELAGEQPADSRRQHESGLLPVANAGDVVDGAASSTGNLFIGPAASLDENVEPVRHESILTNSVGTRQAPTPTKLVGLEDEREERDDDQMEVFRQAIHVYARTVIEAAVKKHGSQRAVGELVGKDQRTISYWKHEGAAPADIPLLAIIAEVEVGEVLRSVSFLCDELNRTRRASQSPSR